MSFTRHASVSRCWSQDRPSRCTRQLLSRSALGARFRFLPPKSGFAAALPAVRCGSILCLCSAIGSHSARAYAAALAVRRRVRCLLQSHLTADPRALLRRAMAEHLPLAERVEHAVGRLPTAFDGVAKGLPSSRSRIVTLKSEPGLPMKLRSASVPAIASSYGTGIAAIRSSPIPQRWLLGTAPRRQCPIDASG